MRLSFVLVLVSAFAITVISWLPPAQAGEELTRWESVQQSAVSASAERQALPAYRFATDDARSSTVSDMKRFGAAEPLALAAGDFDEDGVPDLVCGYGIAGGGVVSLRRGNVDSLFPNAPAARERKSRGVFQSAPFLADLKLGTSPLRLSCWRAGILTPTAMWTLSRRPTARTPFIGCEAMAKGASRRPGVFRWQDQ